MERGRITWPQLSMLLYLMVGATSVLALPTISAQFAKHDMWLSPIVGSVTGFFTLAVVLKLHSYYPELTLVQQAELLLGRWLGGAANVVVLLFIWHGTGLITREYGEFIVGSVLIRTPQPVVVFCFIFICAVAIRGGIEVIGRFSMLIAPVFLGFIVLIPLMLIPNLDVMQTFPVLEHGWEPVWKGSILPLIWFMEFALAGLILPFVKGSRSKWKWGMSAVALMLFTMVVTNLTCLWFFGTLSSMFTFPIFAASRYISLGDFFEHMEAIIMVLWVLSGFVQVITWYYILVIGTAQWLKLEDYRPIVFPIGLLMIIMTFWITDNMQDMIDLFMTTEPLLSATVQVVYPALLLGLAWLRQRGKGKDEGRSGGNGPEAKHGAAAAGAKGR
ncbi:spore germination protein [Paenibacillus thiaminolyticus]|nr:spore germination protein [Paenibacillus thiaminolyticus]